MNKKEELRAKRMARNKKSFIFITILCMGIGFALLSSNLTITGNTNVSGNSWNVYFNSVEVTSGSVDATTAPTVTGTMTTSLDYTILLDKPGDFYEFTVEAKNDGTIDAAVSSITEPNIASRVLQYLNYSVTYSDGSEVKATDVLKAKTSTTYKIRIEYRTDIEASDLDENGVNLNLTFGVNYTQSDVKDSVFANLVKSNALSDSNINFGAISSESNGRGLYVLSGTQNRSYPIYYYRGAVTNNNAKFAGFCWKIVRTTETGGTKLIYNGIPDGNGQCTNTTGEETQLNLKSNFNIDNNSLAYTGYMYGLVYNSNYDEANNSHKYGESFEYDVNSGTYTLINTRDGIDNTHHYTCFSSNTSCESVNYVYRLIEFGPPEIEYITLEDGKSVEDAVTEMNTNANSSVIKTTIDNWFDNALRTYFTTNNKNYNDYLEDTVWCNDRSMNTMAETGQYSSNGWIPNGGDLGERFWFSSYGRMAIGAPNLTCSNKNDSYTVTESETGNGALTYPIGLLTTDEIVLAGSLESYVANPNTDFYLYTNQIWWTMSPCVYGGAYAIGGDGYAMGYNVGSGVYGGVRPSISLRPEVKIAAGGDGSTASPYEFVVE